MKKKLNKTKAVAAVIVGSTIALGCSDETKPSADPAVSATTVSLAAESIASPSPTTGEGPVQRSGAEPLQRLHDLIEANPAAAVERYSPRDLKELAAASDIAVRLKIERVEAVQDVFENGRLTIHRLRFIGTLIEGTFGEKAPTQFALTVGGPLLDSEKGQAFSRSIVGSELLVFLVDEEARFRAEHPSDTVPAVASGLFTPTVSYALLAVADGSLVAPLSEHQAFNNSLAGLDFESAGAFISTAWDGPSPVTGTPGLVG
jgi:hypothetical protein